MLGGDSGLVNATYYQYYSTGAWLPSEDAINLDSKYDDGFPTTGRVQGVNETGCSNVGGGSYFYQTGQHCAIVFLLSSS